MEKKDEMNRRSMLKTAGAGLGLALAAGCTTASTGEARKVAIPEWGEFHHVGIPTQTKHDNEYYIEGGKVFITSPDHSVGRIEWCRWEPDSEDPELLRTTTHIAFNVEDVDAAMTKAEKDGNEIFLEPFVPFEGVKVGFIKHEGVLIEFLEKTAEGEQKWPPA